MSASSVARRPSLFAIAFALVASSVGCGDREMLAPGNVGDLPRGGDDAFGFGGLTQAATPLSFITMTGGFLHSCAIEEITGAAYCWGKNSYGQLGDGTTTDALVPRLVSGSLQFVKITAGGEHTCALTAAATAYCWGLNWNGQLGDGTLVNRSVPTLAAGGQTGVQISAGLLHTCGLTSSGIAGCWGSNSSGQLGNGTTVGSSVPVIVSGLLFSSIDVGRVHSCGLSAGSAYCWGDNRAGQIGNGAQSNQLTPARASAGVSFTKLNAGSFFTCALTSAGSAYCWGANDRGQIGMGSTNVFETRPARVLGGIAFSEIGAGAMHACGRATSGVAYCWGDNRYGQIGDGSNTDSNVPVAVTGGAAFTGISVGYFHSCGRGLSGEGVCWGFNSNGQVGDGGTIHRNLPVPLGAPLPALARVGKPIRLAL